MKWSAYLSSFFSGLIFFPLFLSCLLAVLLAYKSYSEKKKKKEIDKWGGGQDYLASGTNTNTHMIMIMMHSISLVGLTSPHLTSPHLSRPRSRNRRRIGRETVG